MTQNPNTVLFKFTPQSMQDLQTLAKQLGTSIDNVIAQALALLKFAQGRKIVFQGKSDKFETTRYTDKPTQIQEGK